jgi:hypothetical protein
MRLSSWALSELGRGSPDHCQGSAHPASSSPGQATSAALTKARSLPRALSESGGSVRAGQGPHPPPWVLLSAAYPTAANRDHENRPDDNHHAAGGPDQTGIETGRRDGLGHGRECPDLDIAVA